jgi:hypothetical protein
MHLKYSRKFRLGIDAKKLWSFYGDIDFEIWHRFFYCFM